MHRFKCCGEKLPSKTGLLQPSPLPVGLGTNSNSPCLSDRFGMVGKNGEMSSVGTTASLFNDCV